MSLAYMDERKLLNHIVNELKDREGTLSERLASGGAKDYPEYRELCGHIQGLLFAQSYIADLVRKMEQSDDD